MAAKRNWHTHVSTYSAVLALIFVAILLSYFARQYPILPADVFVTKFFQGGSWWFFHSLFTLVSSLGNAPLVIVTTTSVMAIFLFYSMPKAAAFAALTLLNHPVNVIIKLLVQRPRPTEDIVTIVETLSSYSFPSGHVMHFTVFYGFILFVTLHTKKIPVVLRQFFVSMCIFLIAFIGPSRIFLGAHWLSDVIGGYLFGAILLIPLIVVYHRFTKP